MKIQRNYCVVGAGPSSLIAVLALLDRGHRVTVVNPSELSCGENVFSARLILKDRTEKDYVYSGGLPLSHESNEGIFPIETRHTGGLSNVWGGVFFPGYRSHYRRLGLDEDFYIRVERMLVNFLEIETSPIHSWDLEGVDTSSGWPKYKFYPPQMALDKKGDIWSAKEAWDYLYSLKDVSLISGIVLAFSEKRDSVEVKIRTKLETKVESFDRLLLGAGPVGNAKIALNSSPDSDEICLQDSAVSYCLAVSLSRGKPKELMRPLRCGFETLNGYPTRYFQIYELSEQLMRSIRFSFIRFMVKAINRSLGNSLRVVMIFKNGENSKGLSIKKINEKIYIQSRPPDKSRLGRFTFPRFIQFICKERLVLLPILKKAKVGEGAHLAGDFNHSGRNVWAIGMSSSSKVYAGPVTFSAMALTLKIIDELEGDN